MPNTQDIYYKAKMEAYEDIMQAIELAILKGEDFHEELWKVSHHAQKKWIEATRERWPAVRHCEESLAC